MTRELLIHADWLATVERLGGAEQLEEEAAREVRCAVDLLRLTLAYCLGSMGLRLTAGWAEASGLAAFSKVALLKRLRRTAPWLETLVGRLLLRSLIAAIIPAPPLAAIRCAAQRLNRHIREPTGRRRCQTVSPLS